MKLLILPILLLPIVANAKLSNKTELSILKVSGNTELETYSTQTKFEKKFKIYTANFGGHYTLASGEVEKPNGDRKIKETARNWDINSSVDRKLNKNKSLTTGFLYEGDIFAGIKQRDNYDLGGKFLLADTDLYKNTVEFSYRYTLERRVERDDNNEDEFIFHKAKLKHDISKKINHMTFANSFEYLPNFTDGEDYQVRVEPSFSVVLTDIFSLKLSYLSLYDNLPAPDSQMHDFQYRTSLHASF